MRSLLSMLARLRRDPAAEHAEDMAAAARASEVRFRSLTALSADWFWEADRECRMTWLTGGAELVHLLAGASSYGKRLWELPFIEVEPAALAAHLDCLAQRGRFHDFEIASRTPGGVRRIHVVSGEPRFDESGEFIGYRGVGRDVTARRSDEQALALAKERLELAIQGANTAIWELDIPARRTFLGEGWPRLLSSTAAVSAAVSMDSLQQAHPQDREGMHRAFVAAITGASQEFVAEGRFPTAQGDWKWLLVTGRVTGRDADGRALRMSGTAVDIDARKRAEQATRDAEQRYRALVDLSPDGVIVSSGGYVEYANAAAARLLGAAHAGALSGLRSESLVHADSRARFRERERYHLAGPGQSQFEEYRLQRVDGGSSVAELAAVSFMERGRLVLQTVLRDAVPAREAREKLAEREQRYRDLVEASGEYVWETDASWRYTHLSARVEAVLGFTPAEMLGRTPREFMTLGEARSVEAWFAQQPAGAPFRDLVHRSMTRAGRVIWQSISGLPVFDKAGRIAGYRGTGADITAQRQAEERIQYLATRDAQTGLPNRLLLSERAGQAIAAAARSRGQLALLSFDLDRFKLVNDTLGHAAGDALLRAVGERLANTLRAQDTLARLGSDEFALLWDGLKSDAELDVVVQRIRNTLAPPFTVDGRSLGVSACIGVAVYPVDGATFAELMRHADVAMGHAKASGRGGMARYAPDMDRLGIERLALENDLRRALSQGELVLHFQPVVAGRLPAQGGHIAGAEVLVRWQHPRRGLLMPDAFIPVAEEIGLIRAIGEWTTDRALAQIGAWKDAGVPAWFALNVSSQELAEGEAYVARLAAALRRNGVHGGAIELEVTERALMENVSDNIATLRSIGELGVRLAIDDFGTGYSSLAYLRRLPIDKLKIDQSFVREIAANRDDAIIVETVASMARNLGLHVAAEGVETDAQLERLVALGCAEWQGHRYSPPLDARAFELLLQGDARTRPLRRA